jgi:hypothetical protein
MFPCSCEIERWTSPIAAVVSESLEDVNKHDHRERGKQVVVGQAEKQRKLG